MIKRVGDRVEEGIGRLMAGVSAAWDATTAWPNGWVMVEVLPGYRVDLPLPAWTQWVGMNASGCVYAYGGEPELGDGLYWEYHGIRSMIVRVVDMSRYDWRECLVSLEETSERPGVEYWSACPIWARTRR